MALNKTEAMNAQVLWLKKISTQLDETCAERECRARRPLTSTVLLSFIELGMCVYILSLNLCVILCTHEMLL